MNPDAPRSAAVEAAWEALVGRCPDDDWDDDDGLCHCQAPVVDLDGPLPSGCDRCSRCGRVIEP